ncbi:hypothetical protein FIBSPDRAFT_878794 [Athelia psychrophila]|uniref:Uncharacterized protein n=1 Tax=Athelia psychrophila TaxID=1759441 RepID=A0A167UPS7_9AGAM|nr:hypothetical protein FIBSPDRAFT_878794 [Fibularhizoctonia sp. CBS 109695]
MAGGIHIIIANQVSFCRVGRSRSASSSNRTPPPRPGPDLGGAVDRSLPFFPV